MLLGISVSQALNAGQTRGNKEVPALQRLTRTVPVSLEVLAGGRCVSHTLAWTQRLGEVEVVEEGSEL